MRFYYKWCRVSLRLRLSPFWAELEHDEMETCFLHWFADVADVFRL